MSRASATRRIARFGFATVLLSLAAGIGIAHAQDHGAAFDRDYVNGQVEYQKGNAALFRQEIENGSDPELKQFASQTLPKIEDHLQRALRLAGASSGDSA
jgi:predicted outer membrane protein